MIICSEEMDRLKESVENGELHENDIYCDYDDYDDEYGHNYIDEEQRNFIREANQFFSENRLRYVAKYGVENVQIVSLRDGEHWSDYEL